MFTGIVKGIGSITYVQQLPGLLRYRVALPLDLSTGIEIGASIAIDGVCQTVVEVFENEVTFEAIQETLERTTLKELTLGNRVNIERSARIGDEIGGHLLSGHVYGTVEVAEISAVDHTVIWRFTCRATWTQYLFSKGFVALNGCSLTLVDVDDRGTFSVHLIPETLRRTTFADKKVGDAINLELDAMTQATVDTVLRTLSRFR